MTTAADLAWTLFAGMWHASERRSRERMGMWVEVLRQQASVAVSEMLRHVEQSR